MMVMQKITAEKFILLVKIFSSVVCVAIFIYLMIGTVDKFSKKTTTTGIRIKKEESTEKHPPSITFCPSKAFRARGLFYTEKSYLENTFNNSDIFDEATLTLLNNSTLYTLTENRCLFHQHFTNSFLHKSGIRGFIALTVCVLLFFGKWQNSCS